MRRHFVLVIAVAAFLLAAVNMFFSRRQDTTSPRKIQSSQVWLTKIQSRLDRLESQLNDALARFAGFSSSPASDEAPKSPRSAEEPGLDLRGEVAGIHSLIGDLSYRIEALEQDPVNRGYTFIGSENAQLRLEGIRTLRRLARFDPAARDAIRNVLQDPNVQVRREAVDALGDLGDREAAPLMAQMLGDPDPGVRREAIDSFADWGYKEASPLVGQMLQDPDASVRREAVVALGTLSAGEASPQIVPLLSDSSAQVREQAADVLGRLKATGGATALLQALNDSNQEVRGEVIASLGEIGAVEAVPYLRDMYNTDPGRNRLRLVRALRSLGDQQPFQQEVQRLSQVVLSGDDARARGRAIQTLSSFARDEARDVFTQALEDSSEWVRREAERALRRR